MSYPITQATRANGVVLNVPQDVPAIGEQCYLYDPLTGARSVVIFGGLVNAPSELMDGITAVASKGIVIKPDGTELVFNTVQGFNRDPENTPRLIKGKWLPLNPITGPAPAHGIPESMQGEEPKDDGPIFNPSTP